MLTREWKMSSRCNGGVTCVKVRLTDAGTVVVGCTKRNVGELYFSPTEWSDFIDAVKAGEFDLPA